jgi:cytoskeletal protein RodZ
VTKKATRSNGKEVNAVLQSMKARLLALAAAGAILVSGLVGIAAVNAQTTTPTPTSPPAATQQVPDGSDQEASEAPGSETVEPNEPALPGGGHADQDGVDVQHDFQGIE